jgi:hypothetical protein
VGLDSLCSGCEGCAGGGDPLDARMGRCALWRVLRLLAVFLCAFGLQGDLVDTHALKSAPFLVVASFPFGGIGASVGEGHGLCVGLCVARREQDTCVLGRKLRSAR